MTSAFTIRQPHHFLHAWSSAAMIPHSTGGGEKLGKSPGCE
jgi:hypothetical protein